MFNKCQPALSYGVGYSNLQATACALSLLDRGGVHVIAFIVVNYHKFLVFILPSELNAKCSDTYIYILTSVDWLNLLCSLLLVILYQYKLKLVKYKVIH